MMDLILAITLSLLLIFGTGWIIYFKDARAWRYILKKLDNFQYRQTLTLTHYLEYEVGEEQITIIATSDWEYIGAMVKQGSEKELFILPEPYLFLSAQIKRKLKELTPTK